MLTPAQGRLKVVHCSAPMRNSDYKALYERTRFLFQLEQELQRFSVLATPDRVVRVSAKKLGEALDADLYFHGDLPRGAEPPAPLCLALSPRGETSLDGRTEGRADSTPVKEMVPIFRTFLHRRRFPQTWTIILVEIRVGDRAIALLAFQRFQRNFSREESRFAWEAGSIIGWHLQRREEERVSTVKERISTKIFSELRPKDVVYQILHGLKKLFQYDHSAAILIFRDEPASLSVEAEVITWTKAKSQRIGRSIELNDGLRHWLFSTPHAVLLQGTQLDASLAGESSPAALLGPVIADIPEGPESRGRMYAVLRRGKVVLGLIQILSKDGGFFTEGDRRTLDAFLPLAAATVYNSELYATHHDRLVHAERRVGLADLARAISHDLNNAFGVILPLLQALQRDLTRGIDAARIERDLEVIEHYTASCARIFKGMLEMGHGDGEPMHWYDVNAILEAVVTMIRVNLQERNIRVETRYHDGLPRAYLRRGEFEQVILNLIYNARDAMPEGGTLTLITRSDRGGIVAEVVDTGVGIPEALRSKVFEPFFTTKSSGTGLGLDICRSILWEYDGSLDLIPNSGGPGTTARVWIPRQSDRVSVEIGETVRAEESR